MSTIDPTRLLFELRSLALEAQRTPFAAPGPGAVGSGGPAGSATAGGAATPDFGAILKTALAQVSDTEANANALGTAFEQGQPGIDITRVMIEAQKATLAFRAMTEVRNRLVSAYQDVMNMPM